MVTLTTVHIRNLDDQVLRRLRARAARHGRTVEAEIRAILTDAVGGPEEPDGLFQAIVRRFGALGGVNLEPPPRIEQPRAAEFGPPSPDQL